METSAAAERIKELESQVEALQRFKSYCHARLDAAGVPADPESPHKAEGCRVGGRLDLVFAERDQLRSETERLARNTQQLVSGFRSHLGDLIRRIGPGRRPEDIKAALEDIHNAYNSWADKSAEQERDRLRAVLNEAYQNVCGALCWGYDPCTDAAGDLPRALAEVFAQLARADRERVAALEEFAEATLFTFRLNSDAETEDWVRRIGQRAAELLAAAKPGGAA